jgi:mRNA-degrading endonuclease YafQ of YafQ-DinJ toxin-antitoxin module
MIEEIVIPYSLKKRIKKLPLEIRKKFYWSLNMLLNNETHPSLRNKKIEGTLNYWEFSITMNYRCIYRREKNKALILEIGKHEDVF